MNSEGVHVSFARGLILFIIIVYLSLLIVTNLNQMPEMLLFVCSRMVDETKISSKLLVADRTKEVRGRKLCWCCLRLAPRP